ncbi:hypothetical protein [Selenomonas ruminantium]|uniref:Uncharacterized protein n=1 Tax=Selenomonas ruminantium TaxID=971 RepID=A0A1H0Q9K2_SELRU|nr:hypothetical protein [Selenomonas ruminantium]SDP13860.1 hypothetical protein SAMN05216366_10752 [Selenomonas ruminantium]
MLVWIERLGRMGAEELFGFGLSPEAVTGEILLDSLGTARICKENPDMSKSQMLVVQTMLDEWIRDLGYCQLSCISAPHYVEPEDEPVRKWRPRELDLRPLNLPLKSNRLVMVPEEEWAVAI